MSGFRDAEPPLENGHVSEKRTQNEQQTTIAPTLENESNQPTTDRKFGAAEA